MEEAVNFGRFRFDAHTGRLWSRQREVRLTPKAAGVLAALIAGAGEPVSRQELPGLLWSDVAVGDDALTSCVQEWRKALGDDARRPRFLETRRRRGYRFIGPVSSTTVEDSAAGPVQTSPRPSERGGKPTVAVLPFKNVSGDVLQEHFSEGITDDIITALTKHRSLIVSRGSAFARGADYVVEGSVMRSGRRLRITVHLTETEASQKAIRVPHCH